jgi:hypothetical protein
MVNRFVMDVGSELFYDPTPLFESLKNGNAEDKEGQKSGAEDSPVLNRAPGSINLYSTPTSARFSGNNSPFPNQRGDATPEASTPRRPPIHVDGGSSTDVRRRVTRGMAEEGHPMY